MAAKKSKRILGLTQIELIVVLVFSGLFLCTFVAFGGYVLYGMNNASSAPLVVSTITPLPTATLTPTPTIAPTPTLTSTPTLEPTPTIGPVSFAQLDTLDSYRVYGKVVMGFFDEKSITQTFSLEWDGKASASHTIVTFDFPLSLPKLPKTLQPKETTDTSMETIVIGNKTWFRMGNTWKLLETMGVSEKKSGIDELSSQWQNLVPVGYETVSDIRCIHYAVDEDVQKISDENGVIMAQHVKGDIWVVDQADIPPVILRMNVQMSVSGSQYSPSDFLIPSQEVPTPENLNMSSQLSAYYEYEVTDVNVPIKIEPPDTFSK